MSWLRGAGANVALAIGSILVALLAIEAYLQWTGAFESPAVPGCYAFSDNPRLIYEPKPHCEDTNAWGMRDHEFEPDTPHDRIASHFSMRAPSATLTSRASARV